MPKELSRRTKPQSIKEWLARLDSDHKEDYAESFLTGEKGTQQEGSLEEIAANNRQPLPPNQPRPGFLRWISRRPQRNLPAPGLKKGKGAVEEDAGILLEDEQLEVRLAGKEPPPAFLAEPLPRPNRQQSAQEMPQPKPATPAQNRPTLPQFKNIQGQEENFDELRSVATNGYEIPLATEAVEPKIPITKRLLERIAQLSKFQKIFYGGTVLILVAGAAALIYILGHPAPRPPAPISPQTLIDPSAPIPTSIILPNGQTFELVIGALADGQGAPKGAEWLAGTEVPRWLVLPGNKKLEKAINNFKINDPITLAMSTGDVLIYRYQTMQAIAVDKMSTFHTNSADLLIVLSQARGTARLVIVAIP